MEIITSKDPEVKKLALRIEYANTIQDISDKPDSYYNGESEPTEKLIEYLREHGVEIPKLPEDIERRKDAVKLMVRAWATIEALELINKLMEE